MVREHVRIPRVVVCLLLLTMIGGTGCARLPGTADPRGTATPNMVDGNLAVLGGSQAAFTQKFGQPFAGYIYTFTAATSDPVVLTLGTLHNFTTDSIRV